MRLRAVLAGLAAALALAATPVAPAGAATAPKVPRHPNIVFVLTDDLSWNLVKYMPHVRAMERHGTTFTRYVVSNSLCCPSRASMFTGQYPHNTGVLSNLPPFGGFQRFQDTKDESHTWATSLESNDYFTGMMGKYLNGYTPRFAPGLRLGYVPPGWTEWDVAGDGYPGFNYFLNENGRAVHHGHRRRDYLNDVLSLKARRFIRDSAAGGQPFALEVATFTPHMPYTPAPRDVNDFPGLAAPRSRAFDRLNVNAPSWLASRPPLSALQLLNVDQSFRERAQAVQSVDDMIGKIEDTLKAEGLDKSTYIVFSSDNGYHMGEHALAPGKQTAFDTDIRVPLIVTGPGVRRGFRTTRLAQNVDLRPTFNRLAHVPFKTSLVDGQSLVPILLRGHRPGPWRKAALVEHQGPDSDPNDPDSQGKEAGSPPSYTALRLPDETYVEYDTGEHEYYNLANDPDEMTNTYAGLSPARRARLHRLLAAMRVCRGMRSCLAASRTP